MAGTRTAPTVDGNPTEKAISYSFIDHSGDVRSIRVVGAAGVTPAQIEALGAALQAASNASLWRIKVEDLYYGTELASNATNDSYQSVYDNVVLLLKASALISQQGYIPAPLAAMIPSGDVVDVVNTEYGNVKAAYLAVVGGTYSAKSVRFTERQEKNSSTPA